MLNRTFVIFVLILSSIFLSGCSLKPQPAGLDINSSPPSKVSINSEEVGSTPFTLKRKAGDVNIKLTPESGLPWETKIKLTSGVETVIRREMGQTLAQSAGEVYQLEKYMKGKSAIAITSTPDAITARIDDKIYDLTPVLVDDLSEGEHQLVFSSPGFKDRTIKVKTLSGYKLIINVQLAQEALALAPLASPTTAITITPSLTRNPNLSVTPTPRVTALPSGTLTQSFVEINSPTVGFVNVRTEPSTASPSVAQVEHGKQVNYQKTSTDGEWYQIEFQTGKSGWISSTYATLHQ